MSVGITQAWGNYIVGHFSVPGPKNEDTSQHVAVESSTCPVPASPSEILHLNGVTESSVVHWVELPDPAPNPPTRSLQC
jgi:hypothetical protein